MYSVKSAQTCLSVATVISSREDLVAAASPGPCMLLRATHLKTLE